VDLDHARHRAGEHLGQLAGQRADRAVEGHDPVVGVDGEPPERADLVLQATLAAGDIERVGGRT
jgi:hypothetical protein